VKAAGLETLVEMAVYCFAPNNAAFAKLQQDW
jgi:uncharacterized surface protein with fasciclin (FAS1) repeats